MLKGVDLSNYQQTTPSGYDFYIIKASEGNGYQDARMDQHYSAVQGMKKAAGFYHYARPDLGNTPEAEADWFVYLTGKFAGHVLYALDWEGKSLSYPVSWAKRWLDRVYEKTGVKPLIYTSSSVVLSQDFSSIANADYGLWIAQWGVDKPVIRTWKTYAVWQYADRPYDLDVFNGDMNTWFKYCASNKKTDPKPVKKPSAQIADEVINGKWGNGTERVNRLKAAGYDYNEIQALVNQKLSKPKHKEATYAVALDVLKGTYGNGQTRIEKLQANGYNYNEVQNKVNTLISVANQVIRGDYGNGWLRVNLLRQKGFDPNIVQQAVNILM